MIPGTLYRLEELLNECRQLYNLPKKVYGAKGDNKGDGSRPVKKLAMKAAMKKAMRR